MSAQDWLARFLFCRLRQALPDGRPLYAYKCRDKEYATLQDLTWESIHLELDGKPAPRLKKVFCLYAAESFRREHAEGVWTWETVFRPLDLAPPDQSRIGEWVKAGLDWWRRPLLRDRNGHRRFLVTIACEGGLPLRLLQRDGAALRRFFLALLEDYHRQGGGGADAAEVVANRQAFKLPVTLRHDAVFRLGGELIAKIAELQQTVGETPNPVTALDSKNPNWRKELPLSAEDETVEALLGGLVKRSGELARAARTGLRWQGWLKPSEPGFTVGKTLEFPDTVTALQLKELVGAHKFGARLRLILHGSRGSEAVAWLTLSGGADKTAAFRREWLRRGGVRLMGHAVQQPYRITLHDGDTEHELSIRGGEVWGELPWVFVARGAPDSFEWLTEGSARTRAGETRVLAAFDSIPTPLDGGFCEALGEIAELGRAVYRVGGSVDFIAPDQGRYRVECRAETESACQYVIRGETLAEALNEEPLYRGLPRIEAVDAEGRRQAEPGTLQWRPAGVPAEWRQDIIGASGMLWLRCLDSATGIERFRRRVAVLPRQFRIERGVSQAVTPGFYRLSGVEAASVRVLSPPQVRPESGERPDEVRIECPVLDGSSLPSLQLALAWNGGTPVELHLPYPQRGATFRLDGRALKWGDWAPLERLGGLHLLIQDQAGGGSFWLDAQLIAEANNPDDPTMLGIRLRLPPLRDGRLEFGLYTFHDRIASMLTSSRDFEARVRLEIASSRQEILACIAVSRFDASLEPNREQSCVTLAPDTLPRLGQDWEERIALEMIPLWAPGEAPVRLSSCPDQPDSWRIPADLGPGPWWVIARDGDWARFRPLLWTMRTDGEPPETDEPASTLVEAIRCPDPKERERLLPAVLEELGEAPDHADWPRLFDCFRLTREFPPIALDVLRRLVAHPRTMATALLKADEESFERVWALAESMPFSWELVSIRDWEDAATTHFRGLRAALSGIEIGEEIVWGNFQEFRERTTARRAYWRALCDWLQEQLFPECPPPRNSELHMARRSCAFLESEIDRAQRELQSRHDAEETWPASAQIRSIAADLRFPCTERYSRLPEDFRPVHFAPFVVAHFSLKGARPCTALLYELRLLRHFDPDWFDTAYAMALALGLATLPSENTP